MSWLLRRTARLGDGWLPQSKPDDATRQSVEKLRTYAQEAGRDPNSIGIEARLNLREYNPDAWQQFVEGWRELGASYMGINTMGMGLESPRSSYLKLEEADRQELAPEKPPEERLQKLAALLQQEGVTFQFPAGEP